MNTDFCQEHKPVLLSEVIAFLNPGPGKRYIDATVGGGGHTCAILSRGGEVLGIDQDPYSIETAQRRLISCPGVFASRYRLVLANFSKIAQIAQEFGPPFVDGILFDLGFASFQIDDPSRGLSFLKDGPLDMRLDPEKELARLFWEYGDEPNSRAIAKRIIAQRAKKPFSTTGELAEAVGGKHQRIHPATKVFQALRIAVNSEFENLKKGLGDARELLKPGGRIAVITFHSGEDRIVKETFKSWEKQGLVRIVTKKVVVPEEKEVEENPRARSGKLRVIEKVTLTASSRTRSGNYKDRFRVRHGMTLNNDQEPICKV